MKPVYVINIKRDKTPDEIKHHGIKDMKWGRRRWQNEDGTLTEAGKIRYATKKGKETIAANRELAKESGKYTKAEIAKYITDMVPKVFEKEYAEAGKIGLKDKIGADDKPKNDDASKKIDASSNSEPKKDESNKDNKPAESESDELKRLNAANALRKARKEYEKNNDPDEIERQESIESLESIKGVTEATKNLVNSTNQLVNAIPKKNVPRLDLSKMSDDEMRKRINREQLERQYNDMFNTERHKIDRGRETVQDIVNVVGSTAGVATSVVALALMIKKLKG